VKIKLTVGWNLSTDLSTLMSLGRKSMTFWEKGTILFSASAIFKLMEKSSNHFHLLGVAA